uniref:Costars domain-containing protein n=1 Tax=Brugia pahangi TaxID=6280 RepID=A0A0N4T6F8_BRUPA
LTHKKQKVSKSKIGLRINERYFTVRNFGSNYNDTQTHRKDNTKISKIQRRCAFCNKNHWDNECQTYPNLERRMQRLKENNTSKRVCFYSKRHHNILNDNFGLCFDRLRSLIKRLQKDDRLLLKYDETIGDQLHVTYIIEKI